MESSGWLSPKAGSPTMGPWRSRPCSRSRSCCLLRIRRHRHPRSREPSRAGLDHARGRQGGEEAAGRHRDANAADPARRRRRRRALPEARKPAADPVVQGTRLRQCDRQARPGLDAGGRLHRQRGEHGAGCRLECSTAWHSMHSRRARWRAALEDRGDPAPGRQNDLVPFGGGGLSCGIATAIRSLRPEVRVFGCEVDTAAPLAAAFAAGGPVPFPRIATFVDGIGSPTVLPEMWAPASRLLAGSLVVNLAEVAAAIRHLVAHAAIVAEGAAGAAVAAALKGLAGPGRYVAIVSGGNIDPEVLGKILAGQVP